jgi:hypothetical protein
LELNFPDSLTTLNLCTFDSYFSYHYLIDLFKVKFPKLTINFH